MNKAAEHVSPTAHFKLCRGVFQGGGCRGAAHAGAYDAAVKRGVKFSAVAGTSAGSIIAALVGAGASSDRVLAILTDFNLMSVLRAPVPQDGYQGLMATAVSGLLRILPLPLVRTVGKVMNQGGLYSAEELERWINRQLVQILGGKEATVYFRDLPIDTSIVATDLATSQRSGARETRPKILWHLPCAVPVRCHFSFKPPCRATADSWMRAS